ncbi:MAG: endolytic transglycosylase MltG [Desulfosarcina sp.]|nr:endolytic transglycosylase MltG [Desulfobacterales bacterium]
MNLLIQSRRSLLKKHHNKKQNKHSFLKILLLTISIFATVVSAIFLDIYLYADRPLGSDNSPKSVNIMPGHNFSDVFKELCNSGIVAYSYRFKLLAVIRGYDKRIKFGEYLLSPSMTPSEILTIMTKGKVRLNKLTIPEGYNIEQIATAVFQAEIEDEKSFLKAAKNSSLAAQMKITADTFEGYLFPDTYYFPKNTTPKTIISTMVNRFRTIFTDEFAKQAEKLGFSIHQIVTLASIIEKETGASEERPVISSVFHNRLKKNMRLESDPTVIYGIDGFNGNITKKDLKKPSPYNTYLIRGLPPGPISNPGLKALEAALYPAETDFLYFVSKKNKTHKFSTNIRDHNKAVYKYQIKKR